MTRTFRLLSASLVLALVAPTLIGVPAVAAVDYLDPSFGTGGKTTLSFENSMHATALALQNDGKIVLVGGEWGFGVARFKTDGAPDTTFDGDGVAETDLSLWAAPHAVAIQADGKIVVAGETDDACCPSTDVAIVRYNTNGSLDSTFDGDGKLTLSFGTPSRALGVAIQADGKIVVAGDGAGMTLARVTTGGVLDATFGTGGKATLPGGAARAVRVQPDGKLLIAGGMGSAFLAARFTSGGVLDSTFSGDGIATVDFPNPMGGGDGANAMALQADGKVVLAGFAGESAAIARLTASGAPDPTFSGDGQVTTTLGNRVVINAVAIDALGRILAVGETFTTSPDFGVLRYGTDGLLEGKLITDFSDVTDTCPPELGPHCSYDQAYGVVVQSDGKFVVAGGGGGGSPASVWTLGRYVDLPPVKTLAVDPTQIEFGTRIVGAEPVHETVTITNTGSTGVAMEISLDTVGDGLSISGEDCPASLAARATCDVDIAFAPQLEGDAIGTLTIHSDSETPFIYIAIYAAAQKLPSGVTWSTKKTAGPASTWNGGGALARTVKDGTQRLHLAYATNRVNGAWAKNTGPYVGVYYIRSTSGLTWTAPKRLNPSKQHAARLGLAAAGARVYATWVSQTKWNNFSPTAPRVLYVRVNTKHGAGTAWRSTVRLTSTTSRVDYPTIAASGTDVHVAYTDSLTGSIRIATSRDRGVTWAKATLGSTSISDSSGKFGLPSVAVDGATVIVAWLGDANGTVKARVSTDRGVTWGSISTLGSQSTGALGLAALGNRMAVAWTTPTQVAVRTATNGTWGSAKVLEQLDASEQLSPYGPQVVLQGGSSIAVAWAKQIPGDYTVDLRWAESANGGGLWFRTQTLASWSNSQNANDWPSVLWPSAGTRYVVWNAWGAFSGQYRLYFRAGAGVPATPAASAAVWAPSPEAVLPWGNESGEGALPVPEAMRR